MKWVPETLLVGEEPVREFSLYHPGRHLWLTVAENGGVAFTSEAPVSLRTFFPESPEAGTEEFARTMLGWLRVEAHQPTNEITLHAACSAEDARMAQVFSFQGARPLLHPTGLEFNRDFHQRSGEMFEVRGVPDLVDTWIAEYLRQFPIAEYDTKVWPQHERSTHDVKTIRVFRERTFD